MDKATNITIVQHYYKQIDKGNLSVIDDLFSPYFKSNYPDHLPSDLDELKRNHAETAYAIEYREQSRRYSAKEDMVLVHISATFRFKQPIYAGRVVSTDFWHTGKSLEVWRVRNGRIVEFVKGEML